MELMVALYNYNKKKKDKKKDVVENLIKMDDNKRRSKFPNGVLFLRGYECDSDIFKYKFKIQTNNIKTKNAILVRLNGINI